MSQEQLDLSALSPVSGSRHRRKRKGIGEGSGNGKTCGKGQKGQRSRSGFGLPAGFEGGQMPLHRRLPKVGFTSRKKVLGKNTYSIVGLSQLAALATDGAVSIESFREAGLIRTRSPRIKILANGELSEKLTVEAHAVTAGAKKAIEAAGGSVSIVEK